MMVDLLQKICASKVELRITNAPTFYNVLQVSLRSESCCLVKYFNLYDCDTVFGKEIFMKWLNDFYEEFVNEKGRREYLAKTLVSTCEQEQKDFILERRKG